MAVEFFLVNLSNQFPWIRSWKVIIFSLAWILMQAWRVSPPCPLIQGNPAVITEHDEIRLISTKFDLQICFSTCWIHPVGAFLKFPIPKKHLYNSFVVFSPNKTTTWTLCWTECSTVFWVIKPNDIHVFLFFFFFSGQKTHTMLQLHLGVLFLSAWPGPWVCLGENFSSRRRGNPGATAGFHHVEA